MREIKFRAWHKEEKFIGDVDSIDFDNKLINLVNLKKDFDKYIGFPVIELMQYTGIKDKNGREIYEGDIVKYKFPYDKRITMIASVIWIDELQGSFGVKNEFGNLYPLYTITALSYMEVIGNIYENNDLLGDDD